MYIEKLANKIDSYHRPYYFFANARTGIKAFLKIVKFGSKGKVLLPAYIGWSEREGSGVFDPIKELGLSYEFYKIDNNLHIDLDDYRRAVKANHIKVVIIIHYFGYVDPNYQEAVEIAKRNSALVLEDEAHSMFSDLVGGISGRFGDATVFSLHKLLPLHRGGMLIFNNAGLLGGKKISHADKDIILPWHFDLKRIALKRITNAEFLTKILSKLNGEIVPLRSRLRVGEVPQTYPVLVRNVSRDKLYFMMNEAGYGVVSLYHTLIKQIDTDKFPCSYRISKQILNLPLHQDAEQRSLRNMVNAIASGVKSLLNSKT